MLEITSPETSYDYSEVQISVSSNRSISKIEFISEELELLSVSENTLVVLTPVSPTERQIEFLIKVTDLEGNVVSKVDTLSIVSYEHNLPHFTTLSQNHTENYISEDYSVFNFSFEAIHTNESYTQTLCYPTVNDCSEQDGTFTHDMHNSNYGDFNGDGYEDLVVSWAVFPHTLERETTKSTIEIYLNDQKGRLIKDHDFFFDRLPPERMMNYRVLVDDFNQDGIDDIFAGTSGLHKRNPDGTWYFKGDSHVLLISDTGVMVDASSIIEGNDGLSAHDASSGDVNGDGYPDILSGRKLFINNKGISFTDDTEKLPEVWKQNYQKYQYPMSSLLEDFNGDGLAEIVIFWNDDEENTDPPLPEILMSDINKSVKYWEMQTLTEGYFGSGRTKFNYAAAEDIDSDGDKDIVVGTTRSTPYYMGRFIQIFINDGQGYFTDESLSKIGEQPRSLNSDDPSVNVECITHGEGALFLRDYEGDGDLDIFDQTAANAPSHCPGMNIYINDGTGTFKKDSTTQFAWVTGNQISDFDYEVDGSPINRAIPLDLDKKNRLDFAAEVHAPSSENIRYLYQIISDSD